MSDYFDFWTSIFQEKMQESRWVDASSPYSHIFQNVLPNIITGWSSYRYSMAGGSAPPPASGSVVSMIYRFFNPNRCWAPLPLENIMNTPADESTSNCVLLKNCLEKGDLQFSLGVWTEPRRRLKGRGGRSHWVGTERTISYWIISKV